jgi:7-keto-8-aminopelargonate synthetase-like enzyme
MPRQPLFHPLRVTLDDRLAAHLRDLDARGLHRRLPDITDRAGLRYRLDGRPVVGFCSNDYLGLADVREPELAPAPGGAGGSRLICGDLPHHRALEASLAELAGSDDAVLFPSGFQLNVGVLPALLEQHDVVASDALNHASLIDGLRLARVRATILPHGHAPAAPTKPAPGLAWWVTESIFSMDGDRLDLAALRRHHAAGGVSFIDEAHAFGLFARGRGLLADAAVAATVQVVTLSKAVGCMGAFVAASATTCRWIRTRARSFVFSTGVSPVLAERIRLAVDRVRAADDARARLWDNAARFAAHLGLADPPPSPIFPLLVGDNATAVGIADDLLARGWHVQPIRPPTVPDGTARLRITVSAAHDPADIDALARDVLAALDRAARPLRLERGRTAPLHPEPR